MSDENNYYKLGQVGIHHPYATYKNQSTQRYGLTKVNRPPIKSSKSNDKISVTTFFFEASPLRYISLSKLHTTSPQAVTYVEFLNIP
jgi:hypothetical protein